jgi:hypothetical protein
MEKGKTAPRVARAVVSIRPCMLGCFSLVGQLRVSLTPQLIGITKLHQQVTTKTAPTRRKRTTNVTS